MESNNIVIKMYLFYTRDKFAENNSRRPHCASVQHVLGVIANPGRCSGGNDLRAAFISLRMGSVKECLEAFPVVTSSEGRIVDTRNPTPSSCPASRGTFRKDKG